MQEGQSPVCEKVKAGRRNIEDVVIRVDGGQSKKGGGQCKKGGGCCDDKG